MTQKLTAIFGIAVLAAILLGGLTFSQIAFANGNNGQEKVTICHVDQETGEEFTITVGAPAVPKHLANHQGDHLGPCVEEPPTCSECVLNAEAAFNECTGSGGTEGECFIQLEPSSTECALTCEGTDLDKENACFTAAFIQFFACLATGEDEPVCSGDATAFFEECSGVPLPD